jgi:hypothetical protein
VVSIKVFVFVHSAIFAYLFSRGKDLMGGGHHVGTSKNKKVIEISLLLAF